MAHHGLHRAQGHGPAWRRAPLAVPLPGCLTVHEHSAPEGPHFNGIPQRRACAMHLHFDYALWLRHSRLQRSADHRLLRGPVGRSQRAGPPVLVGCNARDRQGRPCQGAHRGWRLALLGHLRCQRMACSLHNDALARLATTVAVGAGVQCLAAPIASQHPCCKSNGTPAPQQSQVHPCHHAARAPRGQGLLPTEPHRHQGGGARGVHTQGLALHPKCVRQPPGHHTELCACGHPRAHGKLMLGDELAVLHVLDPHVHPACRVQAGLSGAPTALEALPPRLQRQPLLGVHQHPLRLRHSKNGTVEQPHPWKHCRRPH